MPAKKRTIGASSSPVEPSTSTNRGADRENEDYKEKRKRNNDAVKKTRAKLRTTAIERKDRVQKLKKENEQLEAKIEEKKSNINMLKDLLKSADKSEKQEEMIQRILEEHTDEDDVHVAKKL